METLLLRARQGDKDAENEIFETLLVRFRLFAGQKIGDREAVEDIAQKACLTVLQKYKTQEFSVGFEVWAYGVLRMNIKGYYHQVIAERDRSAPGISIETVKAPEPENVDPHIELMLLKCLEKVVRVNPRYARILNLVHLGFKSDEICQKMKITRNNFYVTLNRARSLLWTCLNQGETQ
jgi:RNA polymerase sigma factor (sigma-70 family)